MTRMIVCAILRVLCEVCLRVSMCSLPASLSESEARVLKLVAKGKSNRQIALELGLSEKTVANHLTHVFEKTSSENRAAAAAFAIRHGLA